MPGNIFRADTAERGDYFKGLPREVFANPFIWDRAANNDRPGRVRHVVARAVPARPSTRARSKEHERFMQWLDR
jgi:hypothetical protein